MASAAVYDAVRAHLEARWSATPISWENEHFPRQSGAWVAVEMTGTLYGQQSIGAGEQADNRWDEEGQLWLHVFVPVGSGGRDARAHAKALADLFRGEQLAGDSIEFGDAAIGAGEPGDEKGNWWRISTTVDWRRTEA